MKNSLFIFPVFVQLATNVVKRLWREKTVIEEKRRKKNQFFLNRYLILMLKILL